MKKIVDSLQGLPSIDNNLDEIAAHILGHKDDKRVPKLIKSMQYYLDGAKNNEIKSKNQENHKNIKDKNDTIEAVAEIIETKQLGSESLNTQVIY